MSNNTLWIGAALIGAAYLYTKSQAANSAAANSTQVNGALGYGSMPGSVGTGISQILGGLIGNMNAPNTGGTSTGAPPGNVSSDSGSYPAVQSQAPSYDTSSDATDALTSMGF
jgi:hypothetical protein